MLADRTAEVFITLLRIDHASFANPILLAYNTEPVVRADGTYQPYPFQVNLPDQDEDSLPQVTVTVDNVDLTVNDAIRTLTGDPPTVTMMVVLADSPDTVEAGPFVYSLQNAQADAQTIQGALGFESDIFSQQVPSQTYTPVSSPGLFL